MHSLLPIFAYFVIGLVLRAAGVAGREQAGFLFRLVLNVTLPALVFLAVAGAQLTRGTWLLPVSGFAVNLVCAGVAMAYARRARLQHRQAGALVVGAGITNMLFTFPFILVTLGRDALAAAILYDLGNAVFFATVAYALALRYGASEGAGVGQTLLKTLRAPIFLAIAAAVAVNVAGIPIAQPVAAILAPLGAATTPLVLIAVGVFFSGAGLFGRLPAMTLLLRMPLGLLAGLMASWAFGFQGPAAAVIVVASAAPIGFNSVTLASIGGLDVEQAAAALSLTIAVGMLSTALLLAIGAPG